LKAKVEKTLNRVVDACTVYSQRKGSLLSAVALGWIVYLFWFLTYYYEDRHVILSGDKGEDGRLMPPLPAGVSRRGEWGRPGACA